MDFGQHTQRPIALLLLLGHDPGGVDNSQQDLRKQGVCSPGQFSVPQSTRFLKGPVLRADWQFLRQSDYLQLTDIVHSQVSCRAYLGLAAIEPLEVFSLRRW